jgi:hypothetical protein
MSRRTSSPSHADMIDSEGVMTPSPRIMPEPITAMITTTVMALGESTFAAFAFRRAKIEKIPPSPSLSAFMMRYTYLKLTTIAMAQTNRDVQPKTSSGP